MKTQLRIASMSLLALVLLALAITPSFASSITTIHSTGEGLGSGGVSDPNYELLASSPTGAGPAYTLPPYLPGWVSPPAGTQWINPNPNAGAAPAGYYDYQTTFDLTGFNFNTAELQGSWAADNGGYILLNGVAAIGSGTSIPCCYGFQTLTPFAITGGFKPNLNTLDFMVYNQSDVTGLLVDVSGTANPTPEPSSLLLMGSGLLGLAAVVRRKSMG